MTSKEDFNNRCFSPNWIEIDLADVEKRQVERLAYENVESLDIETVTPDNKEVRLESKRRKDLNTLLRELDEIKQVIEKSAEKQHRLANLMKFYTGEFAQ